MIKCGAIQDLLPLYVDGVCSKESKALVEEHIKTCNKCQNELNNMRSEIKVYFNKNDEDGIAMLKSLKKKLFKKNVIIAAIASIIAVAIVSGGLFYFFTHEEMVYYDIGLITVDINYVEPPVLEIKYAKNDIYGQYVNSRIVNIDGERVQVIFVYFTQTPASKINPINGGGHFWQFANADTNGKFDRAEVYYVPGITSFSVLNDEEFYGWHEHAFLVWSGEF